MTDQEANTNNQEPLISDGLRAELCQVFVLGGSVSVCLTRFQIYSRLVYSLSPNHNCCNLPASTAQYVIS